MREITADLRLPIPIGKQGENKVTTVKFPVGNWKDIYGTGTFQLVNSRPNENTPYLCSIDTDDDFVYWVIQQADVANVGKGKCQLSYIAGDAIAKSLIYQTLVIESINGSGDPPAPYEDWIQTLIETAEGVHEDEELSEAFATGIVNGVPVQEGHPAYENNAKYFSDVAKETAESMTLTTEDIDAMYE